MRAKVKVLVVQEEEEEAGPVDGVQLCPVPPRGGGGVGVHIPQLFQAALRHILGPATGNSSGINTQTRKNWPSYKINYR